ncbi:MAG: hypothetical protein JWP30_1513 [Homoserinimonas sp.]|nr:hypothetical protein [Homoserinimonas sp.]
MDAALARPTTAQVPVRTVYRPATIVNLRLTLAPLFRGGNNPTCAWDGAGVWLTMRTPHGAATLRLSDTRDGVTAVAWGDGSEWAIDGVPELLGGRDDWGGLDLSANAFLADTRRRQPGLRLLRTRLVFEALLPAILEQKVTSVEAWRSWRQLVVAYGEPAPGPAPAGMRVFPAANAWRLIPSWGWHRCGVDAQRSRTALGAASVVSGLERTLELGSDGAAVARRLRSLPGVGGWTAAETAQRSHGDPDAVSVGDYHLPATVGWALIGKPVDDDGMLELLEPWRGHRQRVMRLIAASGFRKPRFGPRMTIPDHRWH